MLFDFPEREIRKVALLTLNEGLESHKFFFLLNRYNDFFFDRVDDFHLVKENHTYYFERFQAEDIVNKTSYLFIANQSHQRKKNDSNYRDLFSEIEIHELLIQKEKNIDYIFFTKEEELLDIKNIKYPEGLVAEIEDFILEPEDEYYQIIQYYE